MMRQLAIVTAIVCATLLVLVLLFMFPEAVVMFVVAYAVTAAARPIVDTLMKFKLKRGLAILLTYLYIIGVFIILIIVLAAPVYVNIQKLTDRALIDLDTMQLTWRTGSALQQWLITRLPDSQQLFTLLTGRDTSILATRFVDLASSVVGVFSQAIAILILSIYWTIDRNHFERLWLSLLPVTTREKWRVISQEVETDLGAYIRSEAVQSLLAGLLLFISFYAIGVPYATLAALAGGLFWLIPWVGAVLALITVGLLAFWTSTVPVMLLALAATVAVYAFLELVVEPRIFKHRRHNSWLTILMFMALAQVYGLVGMILAPPIVAALEIVIRRITQFKVESSTAVPTVLRRAAALRELRTRIVQLKEESSAEQEELAPQFISLMSRLDDLSAEASKVIH